MVFPKIGVTWDDVDEHVVLLVEIQAMNVVLQGWKHAAKIHTKVEYGILLSDI